jgi:hypothetical protein
MFYHLYTEQAGQLNKVAECHPFLNKDNAELEATEHENAVVLASTAVDMPETINVRKEVDHAIYDTALIYGDCQVLWVMACQAGFIAVPWHEVGQPGVLAAYARNEIKHFLWRCFLRTPAGRAAECPLEVLLF